MKVKSLVKAMEDSKTVLFSNTYSEEYDYVIVDGCFVPLHKVLQDKRKVKWFTVSMKDSSSRKILTIQTVYPAESVVTKLPKDKISKDKDKDKKNKKKKK